MHKPSTGRLRIKIKARCSLLLSRNSQAGGKWLQHPLDCGSFMEEALIKGTGCFEEYSSRPGESEEPPMKYGTQKELRWRDFLDREGNFKN